MGKNAKLSGPSKDLKENFERVESVGYSLWTFKCGELDPDGVYLMLGDYEYLFSYLLERYFVNMIIEQNPSLEDKFRINFKKIADGGYYFIDGIDPKTFKDSSKHNQKGWIELNLELHKAVAEFINQRRQTANVRTDQLSALLKK